ncbi:MAG: ribosome recycling factor [SAR202 cluster bacterium]|nr:ribosome recycling factor [SAR202 cluster bacterium]
MTTIPAILSDSENRMKKSVETLKKELSGIRTGRASPALLEGITALYYGTPTPINQLATITTPEARVIVIQPWDKQAMKDIEKAILMSDLSLTPNNDGQVIRISIPIPTEERRRDLVKTVGKRVEDGHIAVRNIRREGMDKIKAMEKEKTLSQDDSKRGQEQLQKLTDTYVQAMDALRKDKEAEVLEI